MASKFKATVVSNEYINAVADSAATGKPIAYSGVVASSTVFTDEQLKTLDYAGAQSANKEITSVVTSSYLKQGSNTIVIEVNLSNESLSPDFQWASVLIYATYNGKNILVAVLRLVTPELFPAYDGKSIVSVGVDLFISVDKTAAANISVNGAGYATMDTINKLRSYVDNDFNATIIRSDKDGVLNGSYSFSKAINALAGINGALNTRDATFNDISVVANDMFKYAGNWGLLSDNVKGVPNISYAVMEVIPYSNNRGAGIIRLSSSNGDYPMNYIGMVRRDHSLDWVKLADDSTVLHNTGDENANGIKTFIKQIIAQSGVKGNLQGNADTATKLATARRLGGQPFDGTSDVTLPGVNATGNQDTTGNAATASTSAGSDKLNTGRNISVTGDVTAPAQIFNGTKDLALVASLPEIKRSDTSSNSSVGYGGTINVVDSVNTDNKGRITGLNVSKIEIPDSQTNVPGNAGSATKLQTARKIGGVSFDGTQDIDLAGVNKTGNQDTTGNAASADSLKGKELTIDNINVVTSDMLKYAGIWGVNTSVIKGIPNTAFAIMEVVPYPNNKTSGVIKLSSTYDFVDGVKVGSQSYIGYVISGTIANWEKLSDDSKLVHNIGNENISGAKNFFDVLTALSGIKGDVTGSLKGNADTATKLATARTIGGVSFDGTTDINLPGVNTAGNQDTSGKSATAGRADTAAKADSATTANDPNALHKSGDESASGTKTFTGTLVANNPITGVLSIANLSQKDLDSATVSGRYKIDKTYSNIPKLTPSGAFLDVMNFDNNVVYQVVVASDLSITSPKALMWIRMKISNSWGDWQSIAKNESVVHNIGNETVGGNKKFTGNTGLNTVTTTLIKDETINLLGINIRFYETTLGVNVSYSGRFTQKTDDVWHSLGNMPSGITRPVMDNVSNSVQWSGIVFVTFRVGISLFIKFSPDGSISYKLLSLKENYREMYQVDMGVDGSTSWIK